MTAQGVMAEVAKMVEIQSGMPAPERHPDTWEMPRPKATETPKTVQERGVRPSRTSMRMPFKVMVPKTEMVAPPMTGCGIMVRTLATLGTKPAMAKMTAAKTKTNLLMTLLETMMPTFWPKAEVGMPPKSEDTMETVPWAMRAPESSFSSGRRSMEPRAAAERSPMSWTLAMM